MKKDGHGLIRSSSGVSFAIFLCRILGLVREIFLAKLFGGGMLMSAWCLAFMIPNLFRRLLGEGALGTALVPILTYTIEHEGREEARKKLFSVFAVLGIILALICILTSGLSLAIEPFVSTPRIKNMLLILPIVMPYAFFICMIGVIGAVLNSLGKYFLPALSSISLNVFMVLCLLLVCPRFTSSPVNGLKSLAVAVVLSGIVQLGIMIWLLHHEEMLPGVNLRVSQFFSAPVIQELYKLTIPGIIGASVVQISFLVDRSMACWLGDYAVPALNYSDRIIDLPIGIFAVAMGSVFLPNLSKSAARNDFDTMASFLSYAIRNILFISVPAAFFLVFFRYEVLRVFYMRGQFGEKALFESAWALLFYAPGIPFFCAAKIIVSGFHSRKDMKTPLKVAAFCVGLNIVLNFVLMWKLRQGGIALATVISSFLNCAILLYLLRKAVVKIGMKTIAAGMTKILLSSLLAALFAVFIFKSVLPVISPVRHLPADIVPLVLSAICFCAAYMLASFLLKSEELPEWLKIIGVKGKPAN